MSKGMEIGGDELSPFPLLFTPPQLTARAGALWRVAVRLAP